MITQVSEAMDTPYSPLQRQSSIESVSFPLLGRKQTFLSLRRNSLRVSDTGQGFKQALADSLLDDISDHDSSETSLLLHPRDSRESEQSRSLLSRFHESMSGFASFLASSEMRDVFKCALAYFIASLLVYSPLRELYGVSENKHMAATVAVYFHPARTAGSMIESILFVFLSLAYSGFMAIMSMFVSRAFSAWNHKFLGYAIDLFVFCAFGLGTIAFMKQRVNKPTFNTACSVASIFLITTLVKEGSVQAGVIQFYRVALTFKLVSSGVFIAAFICLFLWPQSAVAQVKQALNKSMDLNSEILMLLTENFIKMENVYTTQYTKLKADSNACFKNLHKYLSDAKYELYCQGKETELEILRELTHSSYKLLLHLNGLGSSAFTQWSLIRSDMKSSQDTNYNESITSNTSYGSFDQHNTNASNVSIGLFRQFTETLGPCMQEYYKTINTILDGMPFENAPNYSVSLKPHYLPSTIRATETYSEAREQALADLYHKETQGVHEFESSADEEGAAASCGNFSYLLEEFGNELISFMNILERYESVTTEEHPTYSYEWLKFWKKPICSNQESSADILRTISKSFQVKDSKNSNPTWSLKLWRSLHAFRRLDVQFGIKVGVGAAIFAIPAFTDRFRPLFGMWRGEWGLITYVIIMNKSVGGTAKLLSVRILGTFLGAFIGFLIWTLFPQDPIILPLCGLLISLPCFWIILHWKDRNMFGRFILLTLNLTLLYTYSLSIADQDDDDEDDDETQLIVMDIAFHRFVSVCMGVVWALLITLLVLPNSARSKLKRGLSILWLQMGMVWKNDVLETLPRKGTSEFKIAGIQGETLMQMTMIELKEFLTNAPNEIRLKGPFPANEYDALLNATQRILDAFQDISVLVAKDVKASSQELEIIRYTQSERRELCSRIFLNFYLLSSAMRLGFPLPDKMPSTEHATDRMLVKLNEYRLSTLAKIPEGGDSSANNNDYGYEEDFVLFYSYILVTINITEQLAVMALHIQNLFGVIEDDTFQV